MLDWFEVDLEFTELVFIQIDLCVLCDFLATFLDGYCSTVQGLLDWFEADLGFTERLFIQIDLCVLCDFFGDIVHLTGRFCPRRIYVDVNSEKSARS